MNLTTCDRRRQYECVVPRRQATQECNSVDVGCRVERHEAVDDIESGKCCRECCEFCCCELGCAHNNCIGDDGVNFDDDDCDETDNWCCGDDSNHCYGKTDDNNDDNKATDNSGCGTAHSR